MFRVSESSVAVFTPMPGGMKITNWRRRSVAWDSTICGRSAAGTG